MEAQRTVLYASHDAVQTHATGMVTRATSTLAIGSKMDGEEQSGVKELS